MPSRIQVRRDLTSNWIVANPTLYQGEIGYEVDSGRFKIGDGVTAWTALKYASPSVVSVHGRSGSIIGELGDYNADLITDGVTKVVMTATERSKLAGVAAGAIAGVTVKNGTETVATAVTDLRVIGVTSTNDGGGQATIDASAIPVLNHATAALTLTKTAHQGKRIVCTYAGAVTITVNSSTAFDAWRSCLIEADGGDVTIDPSGVTVATANGQGLIIPQHSSALLTRRGTADTYRLEGAMA